jgi:hypothetical protein
MLDWGFGRGWIRKGDVLDGSDPVRMDSVFIIRNEETMFKIDYDDNALTRILLDLTY